MAPFQRGVWLSRASSLFSKPERRNCRGLQICSDLISLMTGLKRKLTSWKVSVLRMRPGETTVLTSGWSIIGDSPPSAHSSGRPEDQSFPRLCSTAHSISASFHYALLSYFCSFVMSKLSKPSVWHGQALETGTRGTSMTSF